LNKKFKEKKRQNKKCVPKNVTTFTTSIKFDT